MTNVLMPRLSDSMVEGIIVTWLAEDGADVRRGTEIVEIETDKATMPYEADDSGILRHVAPSGTPLPVGAIIATIGDSGEAPAAATHGTVTTLAAKPAAPVSASPVARRLAARLAIDLADVRGSGPRGRIVKADVRAVESAPIAVEPPAAPAVEPPAAPSVATLPAPHGRGDITRTELDRRAQVVARRMAQAKATAPEFAVQMTVDMTGALTLRRDLVDAGVKASVNDLVVKAAAQALRAHPRLNGTYRDGAIETYARVNVGVAVAADNALLVPTLFDADSKTVATIAMETRALIAACGDGTVTPPQLAAGTFTVSNLGMFGVDAFHAVLNPPQAAILAVGAVRRRPDFDASGGLVARDHMILTLVCDHRIVYGADAAVFLDTLRERLERPLLLLA